MIKLKNLNFEQWRMNHDSDHDDKFFRELYPFHIFRQIRFESDFLNKEQIFNYNDMQYSIVLKKIELQDNGRYRTTFDMSTFPRSKTQEWKQRKWNTTFQIIYTRDYSFITVFTKKEDPSKDYVVRFMRGNFLKVSDNKSIPVSELLIKTLIRRIVEDLFPNGQHDMPFDFKREGVNNRTEHPQLPRNKVNYFAPIYSIGRELWICYSFAEDKAHRVAYFNANQCDKLFVVYCNPTYTKHHRCNFTGVTILSLFELAEMVEPAVRLAYENQIRFLQNHLKNSEVVDVTQLLNEMKNPIQGSYEIRKSDLMEALATMRIIPKNDDDFFHSLCCINLINAHLSVERRKRELGEKERKLFRDMYYFKTYLAKILTERVLVRNFSAPIYINKDLVMVEMREFQFSFHNVPLNETLRLFSESSDNKIIGWSGKRLQPIASLLLRYSRATRSRHQSGIR